MAKGKVEGADISGWEGVDKNLVSQAFMRGIRTGAGGAGAKGGDDKASLSALKKFITKDAYDKIQIGAFAAAAKEHGGKLPLKIFLTQDWFLKMAGGNKTKAIKMCTDLAECECKAQEKDAKGPAKCDATTERLTNTKNYTGSHKERFDAEGKGKGAAGRCDAKNTSGYVGAYKGEGTFGTKK